MSDYRDQLSFTHFRTAIARDVCGYCFGDFIGRGQYREVYEWEPDKRLVAKLEDGAQSFANVREHDVWTSVKDTEFARWFAPVKLISAAGVLLLQARTRPCKDSELPKEVPAFMTDLKRDNWGRYRGRIVCHDYGNHLLHTYGMSKKMRKADWY